MYIWELIHDKGGPHTSGGNNSPLVDDVEENGFHLDSHLKYIQQWIPEALKT